MKHNDRLEDSEMLSGNHFPVKALFNMVSDDSFITVIYRLCMGTGFGELYGKCIFWNELDETERTKTKKFDGVRFGLFNGDSVIISYKDLLYYLKVLCGKYCIEHPQYKNDIKSILLEYKRKFVNRRRYVKGCMATVKNTVLR